MKIRIENFGPIKEFEFDLSKDLTFIYGKNNIGKSYAITIVYLIIKSLFRSDEIIFHISLQRRFNKDGIENREKNIEKILKKIKNIENEISIKSEMEEILTELIQSSFIEQLTRSFIGAFTSLEIIENRYANKPLKIALDLPLLYFEIIYDKHNARIFVENLRFKHDILIKLSKRHRKFRFDKNERIILYYLDEKDFINYINEFIDFYFRLTINEIRKEIEEVYFLPASRSGLYQALSAFSQIIAELAKKRSFLTNKIELPGISEPVSDYFLRLSEIKTRSKANDEIMNLANKIEKDLLKGDVVFDNKSKKILYKPYNSSLNLEMSATSSMIAEISPIVLYLKHIVGIDISFRKRGKLYVNAKPMIFIEEPEAHLHPETQVKLIKIFCDLIKVDVKIVITSHSNYMFYKLNNIILDEELDINKYQPILFEEKKEGSIGKLLNMDEFGVDDENFGDVSEQLYDESIDLLDKLNLKNREMND